MFLHRPYANESLLHDYPFFKKRPVPIWNGAHIVYSTVLARSNSS